MAQDGVGSADQSGPEVVGGLAQVVGDQPGVGALPGPAHGHIGQLSTSAVGEEVSTGPP